MNGLGYDVFKTSLLYKLQPEALSSTEHGNYPSKDLINISDEIKQSGCGSVIDECKMEHLIYDNDYPNPVAQLHVITGIFSACDEAHFWLNGYVNKQNCRIWSEANPQVYFETPLHPEKLTVWCALWAGGILLQKR
ncbi:hypothetical protein TNCV_4363501 [Trichonephila clavipes]|nr:hypothetical protein TNCV_4363501 [Trichonephila clavipes]